MTAHDPDNLLITMIHESNKQTPAIHAAPLFTVHLLFTQLGAFKLGAAPWGVGFGSFMCVCLCVCEVSCDRVLINRT